MYNIKLSYYCIELRRTKIYPAASDHAVVLIFSCATVYVPHLRQVADVDTVQRRNAPQVPSHKVRILPWPYFSRFLFISTPRSASPGRIAVWEPKFLGKVRGRQLQRGFRGNPLPSQLLPGAFPCDLQAVLGNYLRPLAPLRLITGRRLPSRPFTRPRSGRLSGASFPRVPLPVLFPGTCSHAHCSGSSSSFNSKLSTPYFYYSFRCASAGLSRLFPQDHKPCLCSTTTPSLDYE